MLASQALGFYQPQHWVLSARAFGYSSWSAGFYQPVRWVLLAGVLGFYQPECWVLPAGALGNFSWKTGYCQPESGHYHPKDRILSGRLFGIVIRSIGYNWNAVLPARMRLLKSRAGTIVVPLRVWEAAGQSAKGYQTEYCSLTIRHTMYFL